MVLSRGHCWPPGGCASVRPVVVSPGGEVSPVEQASNPSHVQGPVLGSFPRSGGLELGQPRRRRGGGWSLAGGRWPEGALRGGSWSHSWLTPVSVPAAPVCGASGGSRSLSSSPPNSAVCSLGSCVRLPASTGLEGL